HPLKALAITLLSIVPHAADVERLFSDMGSTQSPKRCNLSVDTFEALAKIRANLRYHCKDSYPLRPDYNFTMRHTDTCPVSHVTY
ncbi:uncharacterized protein EDB93DRAFT_1075096, partial [Suillus bovinus]|uniref:uncharacterized protein n=1 Tax=Suillus bovinus TaxID=48563 RepID=UPI001B86CACB